MNYQIKELLISINEKSRPGTKLKDVKGIIIHWTANTGKKADAMAHYRYFSNPERYASAHYFVDDKTILRIVPDDEMAYHVGAKQYKTSYFGSYPNANTIGVETCVNQDGNFKEALKASAWLCAKLLFDNNLNPDKDLARHYDITGKDCPRYFVYDESAKEFFGVADSEKMWEDFKKEVKDFYNQMKNPKQNVTLKEVQEEMSKYFPDIPPTHWAANSIDKVKELGLMKGDKEGKFNPDAPLTRAQMASILSILADKIGLKK